MIFCNINFNILTKDQLFLRAENETKCIATVNAQFIVLANTNKRYMEYINNNYSTFDGEVPLKKANAYSKDFKDTVKLPGSEIVYDFAQYAKENNLKTFYLGGYEDSNAEAVRVMREKYGIEIEGFSPKYEPYPFSENFRNKCLSRIESFKPDIIFVGFGAPKQEWFIEENKDFFNKLGVKYLIGSGGTFEFVSGKIKRAPKWISKIGLEGIYRLFQEFNLSRIKRILYSMKFYRYINHPPKWEKL
ncbi:N-acetylglucosaminyldiphosphoundecaprenol N-acetyl-beta-D-mannosaminyltransferase [Treponema bryantii]|uniref:N-acetylglucosaminyldiphosphoundecaprenol N-acetyl-beta-D-mannosaminyltransferase n=1 Tax=Treponema bryantii TaxID=163 RepID=A0A1H9G364_9SPIR|nr:WecB/TagA/CpsF family glycosyltransferase [Treponema bryantii]SEQ44521.1 N-acetylglucosaminyldiphosphoundecaprenol N-acetyl-beta-D-mannosaminyltransferase [Treponema bryantii]